MKQKKKRNIAQINRDISCRLLDAYCVLEILEDRIEGKKKKTI